MSTVIWYGVRSRILQRSCIDMRAHRRDAVWSPIPKKCVKAYYMHNLLALVNTQDVLLTLANWLSGSNFPRMCIPPPVLFGRERT